MVSRRGNDEMTDDGEEVRFDATVFGKEEVNSARSLCKATSSPSGSVKKRATAWGFAIMTCSILAVWGSPICSRTSFAFRSSCVCKGIIILSNERKEAGGGIF